MFKCNYRAGNIILLRQFILNKLYSAGNYFYLILKKWAEDGGKKVSLASEMFTVIILCHYVALPFPRNVLYVY